MYTIVALLSLWSACKQLLCGYKHFCCIFGVNIQNKKYLNYIHCQGQVSSV